MSFRDLIDDALAGNGADYCEVRIEETDSTRLTWRGKSLEDIAQTSGRGGNVRALVNGGWGFVCFNDLTGLKKRVADAVSQARAAGGDGNHFAEVGAHVDSVEPLLVKDPAEIPLAEVQRYAVDLRQVAHGRGSFTIDFLRYDEVPAHVQEQIIAARSRESGE